MKNHSAIILFFLIPISLLAQEDSVLVEFHAKNRSTETVDWLLKMADNIRKSDPEKTEQYAVLARNLSQELDYRFGEGESYLISGVSFWQRNLHKQAMENHLKALEIFQELGDIGKMARVKMNMGNTFDELGQTEEGKKYIRQALFTFRELGDSSSIDSGNLNLGVIYFYEKEYDSALNAFEEVLAFREVKQDISGMALAYLNIANVYEYKEDLENAILNYRKARKLIDPNNLLALNIEMGLGYALLISDQEAEGMKIIKEALERAIETNQKKMEEFGYMSLKEYFMSIKDFERAIEYSQKEYDLGIEQRGVEVQKQIEVLNLKYEDEKKAKQLVVLKADQDRKNFYLLITIASLLFLVVAGIMMYIAFKLKIKNSKLQESELRQQLEHKSRELASYALNFIQKNELLSELSDKVKQLKKDAPQKTSNDLNQLNGLINGHLRIDKDWENFKIMFEEIHEGYFYRLKDAYPDLGNAELKLCALLRLNLNLKESSQILGISSDSVKTARSRLRKKLGLQTEENLIDFLIRFDATTKSKMIA